jgi:hypothetical protein
MEEKDQCITAAMVNTLTQAVENHMPTMMEQVSKAVEDYARELGIVTIGEEKERHARRLRTLYITADLLLAIFRAGKTCFEVLEGLPKDCTYQGFLSREHVPFGDIGLVLHSDEWDVVPYSDIPPAIEVKIAHGKCKNDRLKNHWLDGRLGEV